MRGDNISLTQAQYDAIMLEVHKNHRFGGTNRPGKGKYIKYVRPNWDMRDGMCFSIAFEGLSGTMTFSSGCDETEPMFQRIIAWLNKREG